MSSPVRYGTWSRDRHGWLFGLSGATWVGIIAAGAPTLLAIGVHRWDAVGLAALAWVAAIPLLAVSIRGRSAWAWLSASGWHAVGAATGWSAWQSRAAAGIADDLSAADLPGVLSGIRVHDGPPYGPLLARPVVIADSRGSTWAVVAAIAHPGLGLAEPAARLRIGAGFADLLEGAATAGLASVVALQVRTIPDDGAERAAWEREHLASEAPAVAVAVADELADVMTAAAVRTEAFLTVVVPEARITRAAKEAGGGVDGRARVLHGVMAEVEARLLGTVGCTSVRWLDAPALAVAIRTGYAPDDRARLIADGLTGAASLPAAAAGPTHCPAPPRRHYRHDAWNTTSCALLLPDKGAVMGAFAPVLAPSAPGERRCMTVFFEPIAAHRAERMVGTQAMSADLAAEVRRKGGFAERASHRRDQSRVHTQDARLAEGSALVRASVVAAVTVPDTWSINDFGRRLESSITSSGFAALRLDLAHDAGFAAACIPLGVGLPRRRGLR